MAKDIFYFRRFLIRQDKCAMKIGTDSMLLGAYVPLKNCLQVLDIGTGTGVLALMLAQRAKINVDAIEIDEQTFLQARNNINNSSFSAHINVYLSSIQNFDPVKKYDLIICNPPFFDASGRAADYKNTNRAMARGSISLSYNELCISARRRLHAQGKFYVILPTEQKDKFLIICRQNKLHLFDELNIKSFPHSQAKRKILGFSLEEKKIKTSDFIIYSQPGIYSLEYKLLTSEYHANAIRFSNTYTGQK